MFYPQLVAGPIERPQNLLHQFRDKFDFDYDRVTDGIRLMVWGLFKKVVIADRLSIFVDDVFVNPYAYNSLNLIIGAVFFSFQIYCDFSAYTDIARGAARVMGFSLMRNFDRPFSSRSITEYWSRWHISLTTWFRDYLFFPLSMALSKIKGNRTLKVYFTLFVVYFVSGLWHGANWTFVLFGGLHGFYVVSAVITKNFRERVEQFTGLAKLPALSKLIDKILVFSLVTFALIFFRASNIRIGYYIAVNIFKGLPALFSNIAHHHSVFQLVNTNKEAIDMILSVILIIFLETLNAIQAKTDIKQYFLTRTVFFRWSVYVLTFVVIAFFGVFEHRQFIYFQF